MGSLERKSKQHEQERGLIIASGLELKARLDLILRAMKDQERERNIAREHALDVGRLDARLQTLEDVNHRAQLSRACNAIKAACEKSIREKVGVLEQQMDTRLVELEAVDLHLLDKRLLDVEAHGRSDRDALLDLDKRFSKMTTLEFALLLSEQLHPRLLSARNARIEKLEAMIKACETELVAVKAQPTGLDETQVQALFHDVCSKMQSQQDESHKRIEKLERKLSETIFVHPQIHDISGRHSPSHRDHLKVEGYTSDQGSPLYSEATGCDVTRLEGVLD